MAIYINKFINTFVISIFLCFSVGCGTVQNVDQKITVLASNTIIEDIVKQVGGGFISVTSIIPIGADPHDYFPQPKDVAAISNADIIFCHGAGLEDTLLPVIENAGSLDKVIEVSKGIELLNNLDKNTGNKVPDPHTWMDPKNIHTWLENITMSLAEIDPENREIYQRNSEIYDREISDLDSWVRSQVEVIPVESRLIVSDHNNLSYFTNAYGFTLIGTITGSTSTEASPSAQEIANLEDLIKLYDIPAIFMSEMSSSTLVNQIAFDTGIDIIYIYHASLTNADGPAPTYLQFIRYNVTAIVEALK